MLHLLDEDTHSPLFTHDEPGPLRTVQEAGGLIAGEHDSPASCARFTRECLGNGTVQCRERRGNGRTAAQILAPSDVAVAYLLRCLNRLGLHDPEVAQRASFTCYFVPTMEGPSAGWHAITVALHLFQQPEPLRELVSFKLDSFALVGGRRELHGCLYSDRRPLPERDFRRIPPDAAPLSTTIVPIWQFFPRLLGVAHPEEIAARKAH